MTLVDPLQVNFSRTPLNECQQLQCSGCDVPLTPWIQPVLDLGDSFTVHARIGQSGGQRGYAGITGNTHKNCSLQLQHASAYQTRSHILANMDYTLQTLPYMAII